MAQDLERQVARLAAKFKQSQIQRDEQRIEQICASFGIRVVHGQTIGQLQPQPTHDDYEPVEPIQPSTLNATGSHNALYDKWMQERTTAATQPAAQPAKRTPVPQPRKVRKVPGSTAPKPKS